MLTAIAGTLAACAAASFAGLHTMVPWSQLYGRNFTGLPAGSRQLALTYDDGPNEPYTLQLMEALARQNAKATFFLMGKYVQQRPEIVRALVAAGHDIGNHSWDHPNLIFCSAAETRRQISDTQKAIEDAAGISPVLFRPPFGGRRPGTFAIARELGLTPVMWRVTCYDWSATSNDSIEQKADKQIKGGDVILLHDGGHVRLGTNRQWTVKATENLLSKYRAKGFEFITVTRMMNGSAR